MEWPNDIVLKFLEEYEKEEITWNSSHPLHKIGMKYMMHGRGLVRRWRGDFQLQNIKKKDSLMASYRTCMQKVKASFKSGAGAQKVYKPQWFAYSKMQSFLQDKDAPRATINTEDIRAPDGDCREAESIAGCSREPDDDVIENDALVMPSKNNEPSKRKRRFSNVENQMSEAFEILKNASTTRQARDYCDVYGELLAMKLKRMNDSVRDRCMRSIDNLVYQYQIEPSEIRTAEEPGDTNGEDLRRFFSTFN